MATITSTRPSNANFNTDFINQIWAQPEKIIAPRS